jgi:hypothetical protein
MASAGFGLRHSRGVASFGEAFVDHGEDYPAFRHKAIARLKS